MFETIFYEKSKQRKKDSKVAHAETIMLKNTFSDSTVLVVPEEAGGEGGTTAAASTDESRASVSHMSEGGRVGARRKGR